jgi:hypothetical protein
MPERPYDKFTAHKIPLHLDYPPLETPLIAVAIDYLEHCGGGFLHTTVHVDDETEITVHLDLADIRHKSEHEICSMFDLQVEKKLKHLRGLPPAYHPRPNYH